MRFIMFVTQAIGWAYILSNSTFPHPNDTVWFVAFGIILGLLFYIRFLVYDRFGVFGVIGFGMAGFCSESVVYYLIGWNGDGNWITIKNVWTDKSYNIFNLFDVF